MTSYVLTPAQEIEVSQLIGLHNTTLSEKVARAVKETAQHGRGSTINLVIKVSHDKETPDLINMEVMEKIKSPRSQFSDQTSWTESQVEHAWKTTEAQGQQRIA